MSASKDPSRYPRIAVVGTGAIGGVMAAALGDAGHSVTMCARTAFERLVRTHDGRTREYDHRVVTDSANLGPCDWLLLCTKTYQIEGASHWLRALIGPSTRVAVMQNGVDHTDRMAAYLPADRVVPAIIMLPGDMRAPGVVDQARSGVVYVPDDDNGRELRDLFGDDTPVKISPSAGYLTEVWKKLVVNAAGGAVCTLTLTPIRGFADERVRDLAENLMREIIAVGRAEGADIDESFMHECMAMRRGPAGDHFSSITVDWREGRPMEWDARNAVVGRIGRKHSIPTPFNDALTSLLALADDQGGRFSR